MTKRDLLRAVISGRSVDRVPLAPFIHVNFVNAFFAGREVDPITATVEVFDHFGFDIIHRNCTPVYNELGASCENWQVETSVEKTDRSQVTTTVIHTPGGRLRQVHQLNKISDFDAEAAPTEYIVKSERDFELIEAYQPPIETIDVEPILRAKLATGDRGLVAPWIHGAFNHVAYFYRSVDQLIMDALMNPGFYRRMMDYFLERCWSMVAQQIAAGADLISYAGNIASGKMVGGPFFGEHVLDYENRLIDRIQDAGASVLYHNCGYARSLFPHYRDLHARVYESLTAPPYGDTTLKEAFQAMPDTVLHGGVDQIDMLMRASPDEVERRVREVFGKAKGRGRFIVGTSDYLNEYTPHENIRALARAGGLGPA